VEVDEQVVGANVPCEALAFFGSVEIPDVRAPETAEIVARTELRQNFRRRKISRKVEDQLFDAEAPGLGFIKCERRNHGERIAGRAVQRVIQTDGPPSFEVRTYTADAVVLSNDEGELWQMELHIGESRVELEPVIGLGNPRRLEAILGQVERDQVDQQFETEP